MSNFSPEHILAEIKERGILPRPKWQFILKNWVLWLSAFVTTLLGGAAIALIIFAFVDHDATTRAYLNETVFEDLLQTIPYFWIAALVFSVGIAKYAVRHTLFGYRYTTTRLIAAVLIASIAFGLVLHFLETAERIQDFLVARTPYYRNLTYTSDDAWSHPEKGLLGGRITTILENSEFEFVDSEGAKWIVDYEDIEDADVINVRPDSEVRLLGVREDVATFRAVRVFPRTR